MASAAPVEYAGQDAFAAAANGDFPLVVLLWGMAMAVQPAPVDLLAATDAGGNTLLHYCAAGGVDEPDTLHFLLQQAAGRPIVDARNQAGETPLIRAAHAGNLRIVDALVHYGKAELLAQDREGNTAAHHAAARGHLWVLHYLLEEEQRRLVAASSPQQPVQPTTLGGYSSKRWTALHFACDREHKTVVQYLLSRGFDPRESDVDRKSSVDMAIDKKLPWLQDLLARAPTAAESPTKLRQTRPHVALAYGLLLFGILSTSYFTPWWVAVPLILLILYKSLAAFRQPHGHGHSHGGGPKSLAAMHPSKRNVAIPPSASLASPSVKPKKKNGFVQALKKPRPEMAMGIWLSWVALFTLFYVVIWIDSDYRDFAKENVVVLAVVGGMEVVFLLAWLRLAFICPSDPGTITTHAQDLQAMLDRAAQAFPPDEATYCRSCLVLKPLRSKHCSQCGVCVARMDHHCAWVNRCVGYGNHRLFVVFLVLHCLILLDYIALAVLVLYHKTHDLHAARVGDDDNLSAMDVWVELPSLLSQHLLAVMVLMWAGCAFVALSLMLKQHVGNLERNLTVNEQINWRRYAYLAKPGKSGVELSNPFDRGLARNVKEFFTRSGASAVDYHAIFRVPTREDSGVLEKKELLQGSSKEIDPRAEIV